MRIRRLMIHGFGNLRGEFIFSSDRCNLILEPNESGKSTMAAAILAALYGFPRQRASRDRPIKMKDRYRPWDGGPFALEMDLECAGRPLAIARDFAADTVRVHDGRSGRDITLEFSQGRDQVDVGEVLCGLSRDDFRRCCFVGQREIDSTKDAGGLTHALQRIATSQQGDVAAGEALVVLARAVEEDYHGQLLGKGKVDTEIRRLQESIDALQSEMDAIMARRRESEDSIRRLEDLTREDARCEADLARLDLLHLLASRDEAGAALARCERDARERDDRIAQREAMRPFASFPAARLGRLLEIKGTLASLVQRRQTAARRLSEIEQPMVDAVRAMESAGAAGALAPDALARLDARLAVLDDLWRQRAVKRSALRRERRKLAAIGADPRRAEELESRLASLPDDDRQFLSSHRERLLEVKNALGEAERRRDRIVQDEQGKRLIVPLAAHKGRERLAVLTLASGIIFSAVMPFLLENKIPVVVTLLMAFAGLVWWLMLLEKRPVPGAEEFGTELQRIETEIWAHEKELARLQDRLAHLALALGYERGDAAVEDFREMERLRNAFLPLATLSAGLQDVKERYPSAAAEIGRIMEEAGEPAPPVLTPRIARRFRFEVAAAMAARAELDRLRAERDAAREEMARIGVEIARLEEEISLIAAEAFGTRAAVGAVGALGAVGAVGLPDAAGASAAGDQTAAQAPGAGNSGAAAGVAENLDGLVARFEQGTAKRETFERLGREIQALESRDTRPLADRAVELKAAFDQLARKAASALASRPQCAGLAPERPALDYDDERRRLQQHARTLQAERQALAEELGDLLRSLRHDYPDRQALLEMRAAALRRAEEFRDAVAIASEALSREAHQAYAEWADRLNETAAAVIEQINPHYGDIRFDSDLSFTVRHAPSGQRLDQKGLDMHASTGARDQIHLAVRLAVSEYLSGSGVRLPFVLDDPFASFDDERFARAMEFLLDGIGRTHQVILLSCHETRHRAWRQASSVPLSDRLRVVDLTPLSA